jgi:hypothetical protein
MNLKKEEEETYPSCSDHTRTAHHRTGPIQSAGYRFKTSHCRVIIYLWSPSSSVALGMPFLDQRCAKILAAASCSL